MSEIPRPKAWKGTVSNALTSNALVVAGATGLSASRINGIYELVDGSKEQPPCFQNLEMKDVWLYLAKDHRWWVSNSQHKDAAADSGWAYSRQVRASGIFLPPRSSFWTVNIKGGWEKQSLQIASQSVEELKEARAEAWRSALVKARLSPVVTISGAQGTKACLVNGTYNLEDNCVDGQPPSFRNRDFPDTWLYLAEDKRWYLSSTQRKESRSAIGFAYSEPVATGTLPHQTQLWEASVGKGVFQAQVLTFATSSQDKELAIATEKNIWARAFQLLRTRPVVQLAGIVGKGAGYLNGDYLFEKENTSGNGEAGAPLFRHRRHGDMVLFFGKDHRWWISRWDENRTDQEASGWVQSQQVQAGLLPHEVGGWARAAPDGKVDALPMKPELKSISETEEAMSRSWKDASLGLQSRCIIEIEGAHGDNAAVINGRYRLDSLGDVCRPPVFRKIGDGEDETWLYHARTGRWWVSSTKFKDLEEGSGWARSQLVASGVLPTSAGGWKVSLGAGQWEPQDLNLHIRSADEIVIHTAGAWRKAYSDLRNLSLLEIVGASGAAADINGIYELRPSYLEMGSLIFQSRAHEGIWLYPGKDKRWWVSNTQSKENRDSGGWACSGTCEAGTLPTAAEDWLLWQGSEGWISEPRFHVWAKTPQDVDAIAAHKWAEAVSKLMSTPLLRIEGVEGMMAPAINGLYELQPVMTPGEPPSFRDRDDRNRWLYFVTRESCWWMSNTQRKEDLAAKGWLRSAQVAPGVLPIDAGGWKMAEWGNENGEWTPLPHLRVWATLPELAPPTPRDEPVTGDVLTTWVLDNRVLQMSTPGLRHRNTQDPDDFHESAITTWFDYIVGSDLGDGWIRTLAGTYLPTVIDDISVLARREDIEAEYQVDNGQLQSSGMGIRYRSSCDLNDTVDEPFARWGDIVRGIDLLNGWIKTTDYLYLPCAYKGVPILLKLMGPEGELTGLPNLQNGGQQELGDWEQVVHEETGRTYWMNLKTQETSWRHPVYEADVRLPPGWVEDVDPSTGKSYYIDRVSGMTSWEKPVLDLSDDDEQKALEGADAGHLLALESMAKRPAATHTMDGEVVRPLALDESKFTSKRPIGRILPPLPSNWTEVIDDETGKPYYLDKKTGTTRWKRPIAGPNGKELRSLLETHWQEEVDPDTGKTYYIDKSDGYISWGRPLPDYPESQLPEGWEAMLDEETNRVFFLFRETSQTVWELPGREHNGVPMLPGWEKMTNPEGQPYYINEALGLSQWTTPRDDTSQADQASVEEANNSARNEVKDGEIGRLYYVDKKTGITRKRPVRGPHGRELRALAIHWKEDIEPDTGKKFYIDKSDGYISYGRPLRDYPESELPEGWEAMLDEDTNRVFFLFRETDQTVWELPGREQSGVPLLAGWEKMFNAQGEVYYVNEELGLSQWSTPREGDYSEVTESEVVVDAETTDQADPRTRPILPALQDTSEEQARLLARSPAAGDSEPGGRSLGAMSPLAGSWVEEVEPTTGRSIYVNRSFGVISYGRPDAYSTQRLPRGWDAFVDLASNQVYFVHREQRKSQWEVPLDSDDSEEKQLDSEEASTASVPPWPAYLDPITGRELSMLQKPAPQDLPPGWEAHVEVKTGQRYYVHAATGASQWETPRGEKSLESRLSEASIAQRPKIRRYYTVMPNDPSRASGLWHCRTKNLRNLHQSLMTPWGGVVSGQDQGDGWLHTLDGSYIPFMLRGETVLIVADTQADISTDSSDAAGSGWLRRLDAGDYRSRACRGLPVVVSRFRPASQIPMTADTDKEEAAPPVEEPSPVHSPPEPLVDYMLYSQDLGSSGAGIRCRQIPSLEDGGSSEVVRWGETVRGVLQADGWLRTETGSYVPSQLQGVTILLPLATWILLKNGLETDAVGIRYRRSPTSEDSSADHATWGTYVRGADTLNGWLRTTEGLFLPFERRNVVVLDKVEVANREYIIANDLLQSKAPGVRFRTEKSQTAKTEDLVAWGGTIRGVDERDGWIRTESGLYFPSSHHGMRIAFLTDFDLSKARPYLLDNRKLNAPTRGVQLRRTAVLSEVELHGVEWGTIIMGFEEPQAPGWLRLCSNGFYLPLALEGHEILLPRDNLAVQNRPGPDAGSGPAAGNSFT